MENGLSRYRTYYGPDHDLTCRSEQLERFERDHEESPVISFIHGDTEDVRLVLLEHEVAVLTFPPFWNEEENRPNMLLYEEGVMSARVVLAPIEWVAFCIDVQSGEFDQVYEGTESIRLRDDKHPRDFVPHISEVGICSLLDAVKARKYDLPEGQQTTLYAEVKAAVEAQQQAQANQPSIPLLGVEHPSQGS
jgi:hypothetical protein